MRDNSHRTLELDDLANFAGLSRYYFSKKFREVTGVPPLRYFNEMKIRGAETMLTESNASVRQVALAFWLRRPLLFFGAYSRNNGVCPAGLSPTTTEEIR